MLTVRGRWLVVASLVQIDSMVVLAALIAIFSWPVLARQIRAQTLSLRNREHVEAAKLLSLGRLHVLRHYLLPALAPFVAISAIQGMTQATYQQVTLAFFGVIPLTMGFAITQMPLIKRYHLEPVSLESSEAEAGDVSRG